MIIESGDGYIAAFIYLRFKEIKCRVLVVKEVLTRDLSFSGEPFDKSQLEIYSASSRVAMLSFGNRYFATRVARLFIEDTDNNEFITLDS